AILIFRARQQGAKAFIADVRAAGRHCRHRLWLGRLAAQARSLGTAAPSEAERQRVSTLLTPFRNAARLVRTRRAYPSPSPPTPRTIPAPTSSPTDAPTGGRAEERTIPAPPPSPTGGCDADAPTGASPAASKAGRADSRSRQRRTTNEGTVKRDVAMIGPAITEIGSNPEGAPHRAAMHTCKRHRRARSADDGVGLGDGGRDAVQREGPSGEEQRPSDEKLLHESSFIIVTLIL